MIKGYGFEIQPKIGSRVKASEYHHFASLQDCDDWDKADFRIKTLGGDVAVKVEVSGRTIQYPFGVYGGQHIKVKVTFVADKAVDWYTGEMVGEDAVTRGWMEITENERIYN